MSLTILIHRKFPSVGIVRWFQDPKVSISYATGPLTEMSVDEFRKIGWEWVCRHFEEYANRRIPEEQATAVFTRDKEKAYLKERIAVRIKMDTSGTLTLIPQAFGTYSLAGLESLGRETRRTVDSKGSADCFWRTFDEVLSVASEA